MSAHSSKRERYQARRGQFRARRYARPEARVPAGSVQAATSGASVMANTLGSWERG